MEDTSEDLPDHSHCRVCGKIVPPGRDFCSSEHELEYTKGRKQLERTQKVLSYLMAAAASMFFFYIVITFLLR